MWAGAPARRVSPFLPGVPHFSPLLREVGISEPGPCLHPFAILFYADLHFCFSKSMQRLIARFLLLFALVGTFVPLALAVTATPPHACCLRKAPHQCHGSSTESGQRAISSTACCNHDCCRAVTTSQSAHPEPVLAPGFAQYVEAGIVESTSAVPAVKLLASQSPRAPPQVSIA